MDPRLPATHHEDNSSKNKWLGRLFRHKKTRTAAGIVASTSAVGAGLSGSTNLEGSLNAFNDASILLNSILDQVDAEGSIDAIDSLSTLPYIEKVEQYKNHLLSNELLESQLSPNELELSVLAANSVKGAYLKSEASESQFWIDASSDGRRKATVVKLHAISSEDVLVVAIRGTAAIVDWTINLNGRPITAPDFFGERNMNIGFHAGLLYVARQMIKPLSSLLRTALETHFEERPKLLLTGHSAGGAVAALLYLHLVSNASSALSALLPEFNEIIAITFGAPPVTTGLVDLSGLTGPFLAFMNEGDPVVKADKPNIESLLKLWATPVVVQQTNVEWSVPASELKIAGTPILLRDKNENGDEDEIVLCTPSLSDLEGVVFGNPFLHKMDVYVDRLNTLAQKTL